MRAHRIARYSCVSVPLIETHCASILRVHLDAHPVETVGMRVLHRANELSGAQWRIRALMKKARLPRLGKALASD